MSVLPRGQVLEPVTSLVPMGRQAPKTGLPGQPQRAKPLMRKYEVVHLEQNGDIGDFRRIAPASDAFEESFAAFSRGTLVTTARGPVAVEDILPGDMIKTIEDGYQTLLWRGAISIVPGAPGQRKEMGRLTRFTADSLGIARPITDLVLGPCARLFNGTRAAQALSRGEGAYIPGREHLDGINVFEVEPQSAVPVFHLGFRDHQRIVANGVEVESQHPGTPYELGLRGDSLALYLSLFPHVQQFADFGPLRHPRLRKSDLELWLDGAANASHG